MLKHDEIVNLLKNAGTSVLLELEYELPEPRKKIVYRITINEKKMKQSELVIQSYPISWLLFKVQKILNSSKIKLFVLG